MASLRHPMMVERSQYGSGMRAWLHLSPQLVHRCVDHQVHGLMGCDYNIEEVIRVCKDQLGLTGCQARSEKAQRHHIVCCLVAFCVLEQERHTRGLSIYKLKRSLSFKGRAIALPALERL